MYKRKFLSGAAKRSAKRKSELIECGLSPGQQKIQFFMAGLNQPSSSTENLPMENVIERKIYVNFNISTFYIYLMDIY